MNLEELMASTPPMQQHALIKGFQAGAASRDAEVAELKYALGFDWDKFQASQEALRENMQLLSKATSDRAVLLSACETFMSHGVCEVSYYAIKDAIAKARKPT